MKQSQFSSQVSYLQAHYDTVGVPDLSNEQIGAIRKFSQSLLVEEKLNPGVHWIAALLPFAVTLPSFALALIWLPRFLVQHGFSSGAVAVSCGFALGYLAYSLTIYSIHECAGHGAFFRHASPRFQIFKKAAKNACRFFLSDPEYYARLHVSHHSALGSEQDEGFANYVSPLVLIKSILPGAGILFKNDFQVTQNPESTPSKRLTLLLTAIFFSVAFYSVARVIGPLWAAFSVLVVMPSVGAGFDRFRQTWEHHWMPLENLHGSRQLGPGWVGYILGGGPWGQHSHMSHHLAPQLNWIQQHRMHHFLKQTLNLEQRKFFLYTSLDFILVFPSILKTGVLTDYAVRK